MKLIFIFGLFRKHYNPPNHRGTIHRGERVLVYMEKIKKREKFIWTAVCGNDFSVLQICLAGLRAIAVRCILPGKRGTPDN